MVNNEYLERRWLSLWGWIGAIGNPIIPYEYLVMHYSEPHRAYHTLVHIEHCYQEFDKVWVHAIDHRALELAIWYHDAFYDTRAKDNEEKSAGLAIEMCDKASLGDKFAKRVYDYIMATKHAQMMTEWDAQLMVDIDLAILGQPEERFDKYELEIRQEYSWVPEDAFVRGRVEILRAFLSRPQIYSTKFFKHYELQARDNLRRSLAKLEAKM